MLDIADAVPQPTRRLSLRLLRPPPSLSLSSSPSPSLLAAPLLRRATPTTTPAITASHEEWVRRDWPPGRGTPRWHNRQRLRGARHRLQVVCAHRHHRSCRRHCRRLRRQRGALRLSRHSRGHEAHGPGEDIAPSSCRPRSRAAEATRSGAPRCAGTATRRAADPPRSSSLTPPRPT